MLYCNALLKPHEIMYCETVKVPFEIHLHVKLRNRFKNICKDIGSQNFENLTLHMPKRKGFREPEGVLFTTNCLAILNFTHQLTGELLYVVFPGNRPINFSTWIVTKKKKKVTGGLIVIEE